MILRSLYDLAAAVRRQFCRHRDNDSYASTVIANKATGVVVRRDYRRCLACGVTWCVEERD